MRPDLMWKRFGSNASANIVTGVSSIAFQLGVTAMAARSFDSATFSVWAIAISLAALTPLFSINLSSVVTRQLVRAAAADSHDASDLVLTAARYLSRGLAAVAAVSIVVTAVALHETSPILASTGPVTFASAVLILTMGQLWQISLQPRFGWHYAKEQNWPVAALLLFVRTGALAAMWLATRHLAGDLLATALCLAFGHWAGVAVTRTPFFALKVQTARFGPDLKRQIAETAHLLRWFAVWSIGMAAIQYGLPPLMSVLGTAHYNAFYLAYSLNLALSGIVGAIGSAMLAPISRMAISGNRHDMVRALTILPVAIALILLSILVCLRAAMPLLLAQWSHGLAAPRDVNYYVFLLGFQTIARSLAVVFGIVLASRATAMRLVGPTLLELAVAVGVAFPLGALFGDRVFLLGLAGAGAAAGLALAFVGTYVAGLDTTDRLQVTSCFVATEALALAAWWLIAN